MKLMQPDNHVKHTVGHMILRSGKRNGAGRRLRFQTGPTTGPLYEGAFTVNTQNPAG